MQHRIIFAAITVLVCLVIVAGQVFSQQPTPATGAAPTAPVTPAVVPTGTPAVPEAPVSADMHDTPTAPPLIRPEPPRSLKVFGEELFSNASYAADQPDGAVPDDYLLNSGDTLSVLCWSGANEYERNTTTITPGGDIYLKLLGTVPLAQKTLAQAREDLYKRYQKYYKQSEVRLQVVGRRTIPVFIVGEVNAPGKHLLSSMATVFTALFAANGPLPSASLRHIRLQRGGQTVGTIDIYDYLLAGRMVDLPLKAGDTIFVPLAESMVSISGAVRRPARYELQDGATLQDALALAGGMAATSADQVLIERIGDDRQRKVLELRLPADAKLPLQDGDDVRVNRVLPVVKNAVSLTGAVNRPDLYPLEKATTLKALLALADGPSSNAYLEQAIVTRVSPVDASTQKFAVNLRDVLADKPGANTALHAGDIVQVFSRTDLSGMLDTVTVNGAVVKPGAFPYRSGMRVTDLITLAFGADTDAYLPQAFLYRYPMNAAPRMVAIDLVRAFAGDAGANVALQPRDRLVIKSQQAVNDLHVSVIGEVEQPNTFALYEGMRVSDALFFAGGLKLNVAIDHALLVRRNAQTLAEEMVEFSPRGALAHEAKHDLALRNNDRIIIYPASQTGERRVVTVEGAVTDQGSFPYIGEMRVSHLIFLAKGLRQDTYTKRADLYRLQPDNTVTVIPVNLAAANAIHGGEQDLVLQPRDRLVVQSIKQQQELPTVRVAGFVRNPGYFPLTAGMKLSDLLFLAGGLREDANPALDVYRVDGEKAHATTYAMKKDAAGNAVLTEDPLLQGNDLISVQGNAAYVKRMETVTIEGEVAKPGAYPVWENASHNAKTLYQALAQTGGLTSDAYPAGVILYRQRTAIHNEREQDELRKAMRNLDRSVGIPEKTNPATAPDKPATAGAAGDVKAQNVDNVARAVSQVLISDKGDAVTLVIPPRSMADQQFNLSIPIDVETLIKSKGTRGDVILEPGDIVTVPKRPTTVTVLGGVNNNGSLLFEDGKSLDFYLDHLGGLSGDGDRKRTVVMRMNGTVLPAAQAGAIRPGDIIIVPTKYMLQVINTRSSLERALRTVSELALSYLPFAK